jgi:molybdopterin molybdotransferase
MVMISPAEAQHAIESQAARLPVEECPLVSAIGRVLGENIYAERDQPPFDRVTMDGIALSTVGLTDGPRRLRIAGTQPAGTPPLTLPDPGSCIEVMTGAILPHGCDCVVPVEKLAVRDGVAELAADVEPRPMLNVHSRGLDCRKGQLLLERGTRLGPAEIAVLASNGNARVTVTREPRIVVISTGDELVEPGEVVQEWQIYRSNVYAVLAALTRRGYRHVQTDHLRDDLASLRTRLAAHLETNDVLILSGGVSMGRFDYVPQVLDELGVRRIFHKIAQRPGKPMWFGVGPRGQAVYALPGNPVSTLICLARYVYRGLDVATSAAMTKPQTVALTADFEVKPALTFFLPVVLDSSARARPHPTQGSGDFVSLLGTDGFVELPPGPTLAKRDTPVPFYRW